MENRKSGGPAAEELLAQGRALWQARRLAEAEAVVRSLLAASPHHADALLSLAEMLQATQRPVAAIAILEKLTAARFEVWAFAWGRHREGATRAGIEAGVARFIDVSECEDAAVTQLLRASGIDIAVDLMGHTRGQRTGIFAGRAAPILRDYEAPALALALARRRLSEIRVKLAQSCLTSSLFDSGAYCRNLEEAYRLMWLRHRDEVPPSRFSLT